MCGVQRQAKLMAKQKVGKEKRKRLKTASAGKLKIKLKHANFGQAKTSQSGARPGQLTCKVQVK